MNGLAVTQFTIDMVSDFFNMEFIKWFVATCKEKQVEIPFFDAFYNAIKEDIDFKYWENAGFTKLYNYLMDIELEAPKPLTCEPIRRY